ncbi:2-isopropylmalate synthase [Actinokineospora spheciospongiae]|nr:2-isopropylmalate synthase [Actinokineospora spheciospongiae]
MGRTRSGYEEAFVDLVRESAQAGRMVLWEESARDGAQGKTLMSADFRVRLARAQGALFGADGPRHVVFAAGFPAVCREEFDATRRVALEAGDAVTPAAVCRGTTADVRQACASVAGAPGARVMVVVPASEVMADVMVHRPAAQALTAAADFVDAARAEGTHVDICFADATRADVGLMADHATSLTAAGAGTVVLADTVGRLLTHEATSLFTDLHSRVTDEVVLASHLHNDLGLGLPNTLAAITAGTRVAACSWLGIAERSGMVATEQLLFLLSQRAEDLLGPGTALWHTPPDLTGVPPIARMVAEETGIPLTVTTPIVGTGVGTISTGTPFAHPRTFEPYDPHEVLGIEPTVLLTHLASARVLRAVAHRLGHDLTGEETAAALDWVKSEAYRRNHAHIPDADLAGFLNSRNTPAATR